MYYMKHCDMSVVFSGNTVSLIQLDSKRGGGGRASENVRFQLPGGKLRSFLNQGCHGNFWNTL